MHFPDCHIRDLAGEAKVVHRKVSNNAVPFLGHHLVPVLGVRERMAQPSRRVEPFHSVIGLLFECELLRLAVLEEDFFAKVFLLVFTGNLLLEPEQLVQ